MIDNDLINRICNAHGGIDRWQLVESIQIQIDIFGPILLTKFKSPWLPNISANIFTDKPYVSIHDFPEEGHTSIFDGFDVYIYNAHDQIYCERNYKNDESLKTKPRLHWDHLDLIYFLGYALWNYNCSPYIFKNKGFECHQGQDYIERDGSVLNTLNVRYPSNIPTHCKQQVFYFDQKGLLKRQDYTADVISPLTIGSHLCEDHKTFDGLIFPTHRRVFPRLWNGKPLKPFKIMDGRIKDILVNWRHPDESLLGT